MNSLKRFQEMFCFREYIREKACVNIVIAHADIVSAQSLTRRTRDFRVLQSRTYSLKRKSSQNRFCLFIWGLGRLFLAKKVVENLVTLSLLNVCGTCRD